MTFEWFLIAALTGMVIGMIVAIALSRPNYPGRY